MSYFIQQFPPSVCEDYLAFLLKVLEQKCFFWAKLR